MNLIWIIPAKESVADHQFVRRILFPQTQVFTLLPVTPGF